MATSFSIDFSSKSDKLLIERLKNFKKKYVKVGILNTAGNYPSKKGSKKNSKGPKVVDVAVWNEFGTEETPSHPGIPSRPFFRISWNSNKAKYKKKIITFYKKLLKSKTKNEAVFLNRLGREAQGDIQKSLQDLKEPPNSPITIAIKKSDNPLIDTGHLKQSISWVVEDAT